MTIPSALAPLVRRWPLVLLGTVLSLLAAFFFASSAPPSYSSSASVLLLPGKKAIPEDANAFLYMGNLSEARDVVVQSLGTEPVAERVLGAVPDGAFWAVADGTSNAPIIILTVTSPSASDANGGRDAAVDELGNVVELLQDQADTPKVARFRTLTLSAPTVPEASGQTRTRGLITYSVLGIAFTLGLVALVDLALQGRARRRSGVGGAGADSDAQASAGSSGSSESEEDDYQEPAPPKFDDRGTSSGVAESDQLAVHDHRG